MVSLFDFYKKEIDIKFALLRGAYVAELSRAEKIGVPIDVDRLNILKSNWDTLKSELINAIDGDYNVYENGKFNTNKFNLYIQSKGMGWKKNKSGRLLADANTFKEMSEIYPEIKPLRDLKKTLAVMSSLKLSVGTDGRNRTSSNPFKSKTGRNQPSSSRSIFGMPCWLRSFIKPKDGFALCYIDWCQQEFGIAAALSEDAKMMAAYNSGDPYMEFAIQAGNAPQGATKETHYDIRERFKGCALAVQYGMGSNSLAKRISSHIDEAKILLALHKSTYPGYWSWSDRIEKYAMHKMELHTTMGWRMRILISTSNARRSLRNFPMQANGSDMLRIACLLMAKHDVSIIATVHDAILIEAPADEIDSKVVLAQEAMATASNIILNNLTLRTDCKFVRDGERYVDKRGEKMWNKVWAIIDGLET